MNHLILKCYGQTYLNVHSSLIFRSGLRIVKMFWVYTLGILDFCFDLDSLLELGSREETESKYNEKK